MRGQCVSLQAILLAYLGNPTFARRCLVSLLALLSLLISSLVLPALVHMSLHLLSCMLCVCAMHKKNIKMNKKISGANILKEGLEILHLVALRGGSYISRGRDRRSLLTYRDAYYEVIGSIARFADMGEIEKFPSDDVAEKLLEGIIEHLSFNEVASLSHFSIFDQESYQELVRRYNQDSLLSNGVHLNSADLYGVACRGYELLHPDVSDSSAIYRAIWGLVLIGISSLFLRRTMKCKFCPRRSRVGGKYCLEHSQSDPSKYGRTASKQYMKYRAGKKAYSLSLRLNVQWACNTDTRDCQGDLAHTSLMAEILTSSYFEACQSYSSMLCTMLEKMPFTVNALGGMKILSSLDYSSILSRVRAELNLYISDESLLLYALTDFEAWLKLENQILKGKRGFGRSNLGKIDVAVSMTEKGMRQIEIAKVLGVSRSTICGWSNKHNALSSALKLSR